MKQSMKNTKADAVNELRALAYNLWWSWNPAAQAIFEELSPFTWETTNHNPVAVLAQFTDRELFARLGNEDFHTRLEKVLRSFDEYMSQPPAYAPKKGGRRKSDLVAYFCAEYGIHECLPMYSGGLGVLAGDHAKSASDLGLPFIGIGLFYRQGYFQQTVDSTGMQQESYPHTDPSLVPVELVTDRFGAPLICSVEIGSTHVDFQVWHIHVGKSQLYLLDTNVPSNEEHARGLTALAYGGDVTTRIRQEIVLGIGGIRFLRAMGITPSVYHINEGHAAFLTLELLREHVAKGLTLENAEAKVREKCVFTTHTPVPAGHDKFPRDLFEFTLHPCAEAMHMTVDDLMAYGQLPGQDPHEMFTMTILALKLSRAANAVSAKHGEVSREMWKELFDVKDVKKVPIGHVTNGIHVPSWAARPSWEFWERHNSHQWKKHIDDRTFWKHLTGPKTMTDEAIWALRCELRRNLVEFVRRKASERHAHGGLASDGGFQHLLSPDALTIGFARRFALYKRAPLFFREMEQMEEIFKNTDRPIQIIFAGKSHPHDQGGKQFLQQIIEMTRHPHFFGRVVFIENYDMSVARQLIAGCDVWLNTPRKPLEASGTSGQKVAINGGLHFSILDGWWAEAYDAKNGWAIDSPNVYTTPEEQDYADAHSLVKTLTHDIIPLFYERDRNGIPKKWIEHVRNGMRTIVPTYNTHRMVMEYVTRYYFPKD